MSAHRDLLASILLVVGMAFVVLAQISGIGYGLYLWAHEATFAMAAWTGFVLWLKMMGVGITSLIIGLLSGKD